MLNAGIVFCLCSVVCQEEDEELLIVRRYQNSSFTSDSILNNQDFIAIVGKKKLKNL